MQEVASLFAKVSANTDSYDRSMRGVRSDLQDTQSAMSKFGDFGAKAFKTIAVGAVAAGAAIVGVVAKSVSAAGDLEQQAANISAVFGNMAPPVEEVKALINSLALDPKLVVGVGEAGANLEMLAKNGLSWDEIASGAARSTVLLANATGADMATASDIATNALGIFGLEVKDLDNVVATFVNSANSSQFGVEDLGMAMANAGPKADAMGWSLEELFAGITLTSSGFSSGQSAGTSWAWMINGLTPSTDKATAAMKELGLMTEDGANAFFNADGTGKSASESIALLQGAMGGLTAEQQMNYSQTLFGNEAYGALSGVLQMNLADFDALIPKMTDFSAVEKGAATRTNTYQAAMAALGDVFNSVFAMIGDKFLPLFTEMSRGFATFVKENAPPIIDFFGKFADKLRSFVSGAGEMLERLSTAFSFNFSILTSENASFGEKLVAIWDMIGQVGLKIWQSLLGSLETLLPQWLEGLGEWATAIWDWIVESTPKALAALWEWAKGLWGWLVDNLPTWAANLWEWAKATWQWIVDVTPIAVAKLIDLRESLVQSITTWASSMGPVVSGLWNALVSLFIAGGQLLQGNWKGAWENLKNAASAAWLAIGPVLTQWATGMWQWILTATPIALTKLGDWGRALWGWLTTNAPQWASNLAAWGRIAWQWIVESTPKVITQLGIWGAAIWQWLVANGPSWIGPLGKWTMAAWQWIADAVGPVVTQLGKWGGAIWAWLTANGPTWTSRLTEWGNAAGGFIDAVGRTVAVIGTLFQPLINTAAKFITWKDVLIGAAIGLAIIFAPTIIGAIGAALAPIAGFVAAWAPALLIIGAAILAVAVLRTAWENDWLGIQTKTTGAIAYIQERFGPLLTTIQTFGMEALGEIAAWATGTETDFSATNTIIDETKRVFGLLWSDFAREFPETATVVETAWISVSDNTKTMYDYVTDKTSGLTTAIHDFGVDSLIELGLWVTGQETELTATKIIWGEFQTTVTEIMGDLFGTETQTSTSTTWGEWWTQVQLDMRAAGDQMKLTALGWELILYEWIGTAIPKAIRSFGDYITQVIGGTSPANNPVMQTAIDLAQQDLEDAFVEMLDEIGWSLIVVGQQIGWAILDGIWNGLTGQERVTKTARAMEKLDERLKQQMKDDFGIQSPSTVFEGYGRNVVEGFANGFNSRWNTFSHSNKTTVNGWVSWFKGIFGIHSPSSVFEDYGTNIVAGLAKGIEGARGLVYNAMDTLSAGMNSTFAMQGPELAYAGGYGGAGGSDTSTEDAALMRENNQLLRTLIQVLDAKNMTANVTVAGGGSSIAADNAFANGMRR